MTTPMTLAAARPSPTCEGGTIWSVHKSTSWWTDDLSDEIEDEEANYRLYRTSYAEGADLSACSDAEETELAARWTRAYEASEAVRRAEAVQADGFTIAATAASTSAAPAMTAAEVGRAVRALRRLFTKEGKSAAVAALAAQVSGAIWSIKDGPAGSYRVVHQDRGDAVLLTANKWALARVDGDGLRVFAVRRPAGPAPGEAAVAAASRRELGAVKAALRAPKGEAAGGGWILHPAEVKRLTLMGVNYFPGQEGGYLSWHWNSGREGTVGVGRHLARLAEQAGDRAEQEAAAWGADGW